MEENGSGMDGYFNEFAVVRELKVYNGEITTC